MVAGRGGDDPALQCLPGLGGHEIERAPDLERSGPLEVFALEEDGEAEAGAEVVGVDQFGAADPLFEPFGRLDG